MRVFLTGATGYIGSAVLDAALRAGHQVTAVVRDPEKAERVAARGAKPVVGELGRPGSYCRRAGGARRRHPHSVGGVRRAGSKRIGRRSTRCSAACRAAPVASPPLSTPRACGFSAPPPSRLTRPRPSRRPSTWPGGRSTNRSCSTPASTASARSSSGPGIVYGGSRGIVSDFLKDALNGLVRVIGSGKNRWPTVYDRDLAELYMRLLQTPDAHGVSITRATKATSASTTSSRRSPST